MQIVDVKIESPFKDLFHIYEDVYKEVLEDIKENGYDQNEPLLIWKEEGILIDGHTRLEAAKEAGLKDIPVNLLSFKGGDEAVRYGIKRNSHRRHVKIGDKFRCFRLLDKLDQQGRPKKNNLILNYFPDEDRSKEYKTSAERTANLIGVGVTNVNKMRTILFYCEQKDIEKIEAEEISINEAWEEAKRVKAEIKKMLEQESKFNQNDEGDGIEWAKWSWNPVTGCWGPGGSEKNPSRCLYCYAQGIAKRFRQIYPKGFDPDLRLARLSAPQETSIPKIGPEEKHPEGFHNVFVCSMADLFGDWVPDEWIAAVFKTINESPKWWNYLFLTKNPERYLKLDFPKRCWIGATGDIQERVDTTLAVFRKMKKKGVENKLFLSCEPLMEKISLGKDPSLDWLIIGGRSRSSGMPEGQPEWEWVESLEDQCAQFEIPRYWKPNLTVRPRQYPELEE